VPQALKPDVAHQLVGGERILTLAHSLRILTPFDGRAPNRLLQARGVSNTVFTVSPCAHELPSKSARNRNRMSRQVSHFDAGPKYPP
jgi:hypothetical protein